VLVKQKKDNMKTYPDLLPPREQLLAAAVRDTAVVLIALSSSFPSPLLLSPLFSGGSGGASLIRKTAPCVAEVWVVWHHTSQTCHIATNKNASIKDVRNHKFIVVASFRYDEP
jgi:hypothetical protein